MFGKGMTPPAALAAQPACPPPFRPSWRDEVAKDVMAGFAHNLQGSAESAAENAYKWADALIAEGRKLH